MRVSQKLRFRKRERGKTVVLVWRSFQFFVRSLSKETCALILEREREREGEYDRISEGGSVDFWPLGGTFAFSSAAFFTLGPFLASIAHVSSALASLPSRRPTREQTTDSARDAALQRRPTGSFLPLSSLFLFSSALLPRDLLTPFDREWRRASS